MIPKPELRALFGAHSSTTFWGDERAGNGRYNLPRPMDLGDSGAPGSLLNNLLEGPNGPLQWTITYIFPPIAGTHLSRWCSGWLPWTVGYVIVPWKLYHLSIFTDTSRPLTLHITNHTMVFGGRTGPRKPTPFTFAPKNISHWKFPNTHGGSTRQKTNM